MSKESRKAIIKGPFVQPERPVAPVRMHPIRNSDPVIEDAMGLHDLLFQSAIEFYDRGRSTQSNEGKIWAAYNQQVCLDAADMLYKLGTEVQRLRLGIQCHDDTGDPNRRELRRMTENWNSTRS